MISYIGLGSNLDGPVQQLKAALERLHKQPQLKLLKVSGFYQSKALTLPDTAPQNDYINAVAMLETTLTPQQLLTCLQDIELAQGRVRTARWGARTLDLDILLYGDLMMVTANLVIPHAQIQYRNFVIHPLFELAGAIKIPGLGSLEQLAGQTGWQDLQKLTEEQAAAGRQSDTN